MKLIYVLTHIRHNGLTCTNWGLLNSYIIGILKVNFLVRSTRNFLRWVHLWCVLPNYGDRPKKLGSLMVSHWCRNLQKWCIDSPEKGWSLGFLSLDPGRLDNNNLGHVQLRFTSAKDCYCEIVQWGLCTRCLQIFRLFLCTLYAFHSRTFLGYGCIPNGVGTYRQGGGQRKKGCLAKYLFCFKKISRGAWKSGPFFCFWPRYQLLKGRLWILGSGQGTIWFRWNQAGSRRKCRGVKREGIGFWIVSIGSSIVCPYK